MLRFAIIGCGRMGRHHMRSLHAHGCGRVVALYDVDRGTAERLQSVSAPEAKIHTELDQV